MRHGKHTARITNEEERKARLLSAWRNFPNSMPFGAICLLALFFISLPFLTGLLPIVRFTQEQIDVQVGTDLVQVTGFYRYRNPVPLPIPKACRFRFPPVTKSPHRSMSPSRNCIPRKNRFRSVFSWGDTVVTWCSPPVKRSFFESLTNSMHPPARHAIF